MVEAVVLAKMGGEESSVRSMGCSAEASGGAVALAVIRVLSVRERDYFVKGKQQGGWRPSGPTGTFSLLGEHLLAIRAGANLIGSCFSGRAWQVETMVKNEEILQKGWFGARHM